MMKFIHAADCHIDAPLDGLSAYDEAPVNVFRTATRSAFAALIDRAIDERVDFMVLAGDIFDGAWREMNTPLFFVRQMARLDRVGIQVYVLRGNHDAESEIGGKLPLPANVHMFSVKAPETFRLELPDVKVALHGQSFRTAAITENLVREYPAPIPGWLNIGVLHTGLEGGTIHANYAPCSLEELSRKGYQYFALGHIHTHGVLCRDPWVVMPGNLQGRSVRETGPRGAVLVTYEDGELQAPERLFVDVVRWSVAEVDLSSATTRAEAVDRALPVLRRVFEREAEGRPVACRVIFSGRSPAHGALFGQDRLLRPELLAQAINAGGDNMWIEKIKVMTAPAIDAAAIAAGGDALADLQALLLRAADAPDLMAALKAELEPLWSRLEPEVFAEDVPALIAAKEDRLAELVAMVTPAVLDRIAREE